MFITGGMYSVTVTDSHDCFIYDSTLVSQPLAPLSLVLDITDVNCSNPNSGVVNLTVNGGTPSYNYFWSDSVFTQDLSNIAAGIYIITVIDDHDCIITDTAVVEAPFYLLGNTQVTTNYNGFGVSCYGYTDGEIQLNISQGTPDYDIMWNTGETTENISNLPAGVYWVTVVDQNQCTYIDTIQLNQPPVLIIDPFTNSPNCPGINDGTIMLDVTGGVLPYDYSWATFETTEFIVGLDAGEYEVTVTDGNGCFTYYPFTLDYQFEECLFIPSAITPNSDGFNDVWKIRGIELYPEAVIEIYNRWGQLLFKSDKGYHQKWDGTYNGKDQPIDTYFYVIKLNNTSEPIKGHLTIVR